jgi:hypothetical protein
MNKYLPLIIANFIITPTVFADYSVRIPLDPAMFIEPEDLSLTGNVTANKNTVTLGESLTIEWKYDKLTSIVIPYSGTFYSHSGSANVKPTKSGSIDVKVNNKSNSLTESFPITVIFPPVEILSFISAERGITIGQKINLSWQVDNADYVEFKLLSGSASIPAGKQPTTGSFSANTGGIVTGDIVSYLMTAYSLDNENIKTATVSVPVRGRMTLTSAKITNPLQFYTGGSLGNGIAIPVGGTLDVEWEGTNIKDLRLLARDASDPNPSAPDIERATIPNPDANRYKIPMTKVTTWALPSLEGTGFDSAVLQKNMNATIKIYNPSKINALTINGVSNEITVKRGYQSLVWSGNDPIVKYVISGLFSSPSELTPSTRNINYYFGSVGTYTMRLESHDYNGISDSKEIVVNVTL